MTHRAFQKGNTAGVSGAMPGVGAIRCIINKSAKKGRGQIIHIRASLANDIARYKFRRILKHMNKAV